MGADQSIEKSGYRFSVLPRILKGHEILFNIKVIFIVLLKISVGLYKKFRGGIYCGGHLAAGYGGELFFVAKPAE